MIQTGTGLHSTLNDHSAPAIRPITGAQLEFERDVIVASMLVQMLVSLHVAEIRAWRAHDFHWYKYVANARADL